MEYGPHRDRAGALRTAEDMGLGEIGGRYQVGQLAEKRLRLADFLPPVKEQLARAEERSEAHSTQDPFRDHPLFWLDDAQVQSLASALRAAVEAWEEAHAREGFWASLRTEVGSPESIPVQTEDKDD